MCIMTPLDKAIELAGGPSELARKIGAKPNQVNNWRSRGVSVRFCWPIEKAVNGQVTRKDLRPKDWQLIWPELADDRRKDQRRKLERGAKAAH